MFVVQKNDFIEVFNSFWKRKICLKLFRKAINKVLNQF